MSRRKRYRYERKLLQAAAKGSFKKVLKVLPKYDIDPSSAFASSSAADLSGAEGSPSTSGREESGKSAGDVVDGDFSKRGYGGTREEIRRTKKGKRRRQGVAVEFDINCVDADGWTPLHHAVFARSIKVITYLLSRGADVVVRDMKGNTPTHIAARAGDAPAIAALRRAGASMELPNYAGETPSDLVRDRLEALSSRAANVASVRHQQKKDDEKFHSAPGEAPQQWAEHLEENQSDEDGPGTGWGWHSQGNFPSGWNGFGDGDNSEEDRWRDEIAEEMQRRAAAQARAAAEMGEAAAAAEGFRAPPKGRWPADEEGVEGKREEKERESQRVLEEERARDMAWREEVQQGKFLRQQQRYLEGWERFTVSCNMDIGMADVPFPVDRGREVDLRKVLLYRIPTEGWRKRIREEVLRWHPDKFLQRWGQRLADKEKEQVLMRVKEVFQAVQEIYGCLQKDSQ